MQKWAEYAKFFAGLPVIANPFGATPVFVSSTPTTVQRRRTAPSAVASVTTVPLLVFAVEFMAGGLRRRLSGRV